MNKFLRFIFGAIVAALTFVACDNKTVEEVFEVEFNLPSSITFEENDDMKVDFKVLFKKAPKTTDTFVLTSGTTSISCSILSANETKFTVQFPVDIEPAVYGVKIRRGDRELSFGNVKLMKFEPGAFKPSASSTVWGTVRCGVKPVKGAVVSDGIDVAVTNQDGIYELASDKRLGYVFISIPSGYEVKTKGVIPQMHVALKEKSHILEQVDFDLIQVDGQDNYKMLFFGDMHLANRTSDKAQFAEFIADVNDYRASQVATKVYAMTLGDMTWDIYWYDRKFCFEQYLNEINTGLKGMQVFNTMGNHDNDFKAFNDFDASLRFAQEVCPTYYSFNIGKVHYVVLDDIDCSKYDGTTSRNYSKALSREQLDWLAKDIAQVSKDTPVIVTAHAQFFYPRSADAFKLDHSESTTKEFFNILKGYTVHIVTGHTHTIFNARPDEAKSLGADNVFEHNAGAVCGSWWWSGHLTDGIHLSPDGTPGGYSIWDINGTDMKWRYKATNWEDTYQFRSYDLNNVSFTFGDVPKMQNIKKLTDAFGKYVDAYTGAQNNEVLINIWNWNSAWKLSVTDENGKELKWTKTYAYDPVHIQALSVKRFNDSGITSVPSFVTEASMPHFFKVTADGPNTDLVIKVTDEFGNVFTENMARPKAFNINEYKK